MAPEFLTAVNAFGFGASAAGLAFLAKAVVTFFGLAVAKRKPFTCAICMGFWSCLALGALLLALGSPAPLVELFGAYAISVTLLGASGAFVEPMDLEELR